MNKASSMDKDSMVEVKNRFKKMSVVPDENCFANAILNLKEHQKPAIVIRNTSFCDVRFFYLSKLRLARSCIQLKYARQLLMKIARYSRMLMEKDDCKTLDRCKYLKVNAVGCMYTIAMRCLPILAYIEKVRQHMLAQDVDATPDFVLAKEDCTIPHISAFEVEKATDFVHQDTLRWLEELEEKHDFRLHDSAVKRLK